MQPLDLLEFLEARDAINGNLPPNLVPPAGITEPDGGPPDELSMRFAGLALPFGEAENPPRPPGVPAPTCDGPCPSQDLPDAPPPGPPGGTFLTPNLIVNGDADSGPSGQRGAPYPGAGGAGELTGWQVFSDDPRAIVYGIPSASGGWPDDQRDIVPPTPGSGFFAGGNFSQMGNSRSLSADARRRRRRIATRR